MVNRCATLIPIVIELLRNDLERPITGLAETDTNRIFLADYLKALKAQSYNRLKNWVDILKR